MTNTQNPQANLSNAGLATEALPASSFPSNQAPLDLNFSQRMLQTPVKNEVEGLDENGPDQSSNHQQDGASVVASVSQGNMSDGPVEITLKALPVCTSRGSGRVATSQKSRSHWSHGEIIALLDAKKAQAERLDFGSRKSKSPNSGKWDDIADFCKNIGVKKQPSQCRDEWERLWPMFKKIMDWERQISDGKRSYWTMTEEERDREGFPRQFDKEIYDAMLARFAIVAPQNMSVLAASSPIDESGEAAANACNMHMQNGIANQEDGPSVVDHHAPASAGRKRKNPPRSCTLSKKSYNTLEPTKRMHSPSLPKAMRPSKDAPLDPGELRMAIEERKLKLAERRFVLEERKLEATMEIGKGLISSMEKMTSMISSLGGP